MAVKFPFGYFSLPDTWVSPTIEKKSNKVVVISSFGNTTLETNGMKSVPIEQMLGRNIFNRTVIGLENEPLNKIEGFFDEKNSIVYLHMKGIFDTCVYLRACKQFSEEIKLKGFLVVWADWRFEYARALLLLFAISHIMLFHHPNHIFDVSYIPLFKALDTIRIKAANDFEEILKDIPDVSRDWHENGRLCSPRVLFIFSASRIPCHALREAIEERHGGSRLDKARNHPIRKMELNLEYQIYRLLRNSRVITNISLNSLFALPNNQPFVYICEDHQEPSILSVLVKKNLTEVCTHKDPLVKHFKQMFIETQSTPMTGVTQSNMNIVLNKRQTDSIIPLSDPVDADLLSASLLSSISTDKKLNIDHSFSGFLRQHVDEALTRGFDDNVGRNAGTGFFELPKLRTWFAVYKKLHNFLMIDTDEENKVNAALRHSLNTDVRFSDARCSKAMPLALATYKNSLPAFYSRDEHDSKLAMALSVLSTHARGPMYAKYAKQLEQNCEQFWKAGRIGCQILSIMANPCIRAMHRTSDRSEQDDENSTLPMMDHDSGVLYAGYCNCGYNKVHIKDPFTDKAAFIDLYKHLKKDCCKELEEIVFPSLNDHIDDCIEPMTFYDSSQETEPNPESDEPRSVSVCRESPLLLIGSSLDSIGDPKELNRSSGTSTEEQERSPIHSNSETMPVVPVSDSDEIVKRLKPSAHDVTSAMLTTASAEDFTPNYSTWSLLCLGPSSLYSHNAGICDQPGFLSGTNFLLPWDVAVKIPDKNKWPAIAESMGKKGYLLKNKKSKVGDLTEFNVKVFLGCEYQCLRGHRFMMAGTEKYLKASSLGHVKDTAAKIANSDMPLYYPCPCSSNSTIMNAQLMRLHVVTPKAPVNVTLNPIIQPSPSPSGKFVPQPMTDGPIQLSSSTYWVLRLPFFYVDDTTFYEPPDNQVDPSYGKFLKGCYSISEINLDR